MCTLFAQIYNGIQNRNIASGILNQDIKCKRKGTVQSHAGNLDDAGRKALFRLVSKMASGTLMLE